MVDYQKENRSLLSRLNQLNEENMMLINRITSLTSDTINKVAEKDTDSSSLTSYSNDMSTTSTNIELELERTREKLASREKEFDELESCFAKYRQEVQADFEELTTTTCHECQTAKTRLTSTQSELKEVELALTRERRSHEVKVSFCLKQMTWFNFRKKQTYFERVIVGYQAKIDELKKLDLQSGHVRKDYSSLYACN